MRWLLAVAGAISLFVLADFSVWVFSDLTLVLLPLILYWLLPLSLWYRFAFSRQREAHARWPAIRSGLVVLYLPVPLFNCFFLGMAMWAGVVGLVPYFIGVHLLSLGYMQLAQPQDAPADSAASPSPAS